MIACTHPGKLGDCLYALQVVRRLCELHNTQADFYTSPYCSRLGKLFEYQPFIHNFYTVKEYKIKATKPGLQPWFVPVANRFGYSRLYHLGYKNEPDRPLPEYMAVCAGLDPKEIRIEYKYPTEIETFQRYNYIVIAPGGKLCYDSLLDSFARGFFLPVVIIGGVGEYNEIGIDKTGLDFLTTVAWIARAKAFIGLTSSMLVLANGFPNLPKIVLHDGKYCNPAHLLHRQDIRYLIDPTLDQLTGEVEKVIL